MPFDLAIVAEDVESYKPAHAHWERFFEATTADRDHHVHVAASLFHDIKPRESSTCARSGSTGSDETADPEPDRELTDLSAPSRHARGARSGMSSTFTIRPAQAGRPRRRHRALQRALAPPARSYRGHRPGDPPVLGVAGRRLRPRRDRRRELRRLDRRLRRRRRVRRRDLARHPRFDAELERALLDDARADRPREEARRALLGFVTEKDEVLRERLRGARLRGDPPLVPDGDRPRQDLPPSPPPEGVVIRPMRDGEEEQVYEVHDAVVRRRVDAHAGAVRAVAALVRQGPGVRPVALVRRRGGRRARRRCDLQHAGRTSGPSAGCACSGSCRSHRRRGLGEALLRHAFAEFERRGFERVGARCRRSSPTGAVALYERAGMHVARTSLQLEKVQG